MAYPNQQYDRFKAIDRRLGATKPALAPPIAPQSATPALPAVPTSSPASPAIPAQKSVYDIQRERVQADAQEEEQRRMKAIESRLAASGIDDSGVLRGQQRTEAANIRNAAGREMEGITAAEAQGKLAERSMTLQEKAQADAQSLALRGMSLNEKSQADANALASRGMDLNASAQELQRQGMDRDEAFRYASMAQAKSLADRGMDQQQLQIELQRQGMDQQNSQFYANLALQKESRDIGIRSDVQKAIIVDQMSKINPADPNYLTKLNQFLSTLGLGGVIDASKLPATVKPGEPGYEQTPEYAAELAKRYSAQNIARYFSGVT